jgi:hypothetical protein
LTAKKGCKDTHCIARGCKDTHCVRRVSAAARN